MSDALDLAEWIRGRLATPVTHLKLQKLCFYCYGGALASGSATDVGHISFEAWAHGPVSRDVWNAYRAYGSAEIEPPGPFDDVVRYRPTTEIELNAVLSIYRRLSAWQIRQESHLEAPWVNAHRQQRSLETEEIRRHFREKFYTGKVAFPENLLFSSSLGVDGIPAHTFATLSEAGAALDG
ncbi:MAG TPA: type II toxin-antitoxin system antitoxin SocA domain-containing protein [Polyangiaceae bacterium]|nr:type II toxin-antitoxin system antitoxin SocA domain-containing protein [Polyangiaceae bacterium]